MADTPHGQWILGGTAFIRNYVVFDLTPMTKKTDPDTEIIETDE
jgi:hypothetical protein